MPRIASAASLVLAALAVAGCGGGTLSEKQFQKQVEAIEALGAEGALVAEDAADGRTTGTFVRVHSRYLEETGTKVETQLRSAHAVGDLEQKRVEALRLARKVDEELDELSRSSGDPSLANRLQSRLSDDADAAKELAK